MQLDEAWRPFAHAVPAEIKALLPVSVAALIPAVVVRNIHLLDVCAGKARISRWAMLHGLTAAAVDFEYDDHMDINSDIGLALLIILALRVVLGGLIFMGRSAQVGSGCPVPSRSAAHQIRLATLPASLLRTAIG